LGGPERVESPSCPEDASSCLSIPRGGGIGMSFPVRAFQPPIHSLEIACPIALPASEDSVRCLQQPVKEGHHLPHVPDHSARGHRQSPDPGRISSVDAGQPGPPTTTSAWEGTAVTNGVGLRGMSLDLPIFRAWNSSTSQLTLGRSPSTWSTALPPFSHAARVTVRCQPPGSRMVRRAIGVGTNGVGLRGKS